MELLDEGRRATVLSKISTINTKVDKVKTKLEQERIQKAEDIALKREDRQETVKRISRMAEYHKEQLLERIEEDNERTKRVQHEKTALLETRQNLRKKVDLQKTKVLSEFEKMKKRGKIDVIRCDHVFSPKNCKNWECP